MVGGTLCLLDGQTSNMRITQERHDQEIVGQPAHFEKKVGASQQTIELEITSGRLSRTDAYAVETEVLCCRLLEGLGLPVPKVIRTDKNKSTKRIISASLSNLSGTPFDSVSWHRSDPRHNQVTYMIERAKYILSHQRSSSFGPMAVVSSGKGSRSWSLAFCVMFEALLEDGEDHFVNLPYSEIRRLVSQRKEILDTFCEPQLVIPNFGRMSHVLVDQNTGHISSFVVSRDAYWGDPEMIKIETQEPVYRCYQAVKVIIVNHFWSKSSNGADVLLARSAMTKALETKENRGN